MTLIEKYNINVKKILESLSGVSGGKYYTKGKLLELKGGAQLQVTCPFHNDKSPSLGISKELDRYNCFVCTDRKGESKILRPNESIGKGPFIQFVRVFYEQVHNKVISDEELASICEVKESQKKSFLSDIRSNKTFKAKSSTLEKEVDLKYSLKELDELDKKNRVYLEERFLKHKDITKEELEEIEREFLLKTTKDGSILIPIFKDWYYSGLYVRRNISEGLKYFSEESFSKTKIVFNSDRNEITDSIILVEGPLNALRLYSLGYKNVVSLFGAKPFKEHLKWLSTKRNICVWFDSDEGGRLGVKQLAEGVSKETNLFEVVTPNKTDAFDYNKEEIKTFLSNPKRVIR